jgi:hypothetical protein
MVVGEWGGWHFVKHPEDQSSFIGEKGLLYTDV